MTQTKVTFRQLQSFAQVSQMYLRRNPEHQKGKLAYAISKVTAKFAKWFAPLQQLDDEQNEKIYDTRIDFAEVDAQNRIIYENIKGEKQEDVRQFVYTKDKHKECNRAVNKIIRDYRDMKEEKLDEEIEIEPVIISDVPQGLTPQEIDVFSGVIIPVGFQYSEAPKESMEVVK